MILRVKMYDFWIAIIGQCQLNHGKSENRDSRIYPQDPGPKNPKKYQNFQRIIT